MPSAQFQQVIEHLAKIKIKKLELTFASCKELYPDQIANFFGSLSIFEFLEEFRLEALSQAIETCYLLDAAVAFAGSLRRWKRIRLLSLKLVIAKDYDFECFKVLAEAIKSLKNLQSLFFSWNAKSIIKRAKEQEYFASILPSLPYLSFLEILV